MKQAYVEQMVMNEALITGIAATDRHVKNPAKRNAAKALVRDGRLLPFKHPDEASSLAWTIATSIGGRGACAWYKPTSTPTGRAEPTSPRVAFRVDNLCGSEVDDLGHVVDERFGKGYRGRLAFAHPNEKRCPDWVYVEVASATDPAKRLYVGVHENQIEFLVDRASAEIGAYEMPGGKWIYAAAETRSWWVVTAAELETLCDFLDDPDPEERAEAYGRWCGSTDAMEITWAEVLEQIERAVENDPAWAETCKGALDQKPEALGAVATVILAERARRGTRAA